MVLLDEAALPNGVIVIVDERLAGVVGEEVFGKGGDDFPGMTSGLQSLQRGGVPLAPLCEQGFHAADESDELRVLVNGGLDGRLIHGEIEVAGAIVLKRA